MWVIVPTLDFLLKPCMCLVYIILCICRYIQGCSYCSRKSGFTISHLMLKILVFKSRDSVGSKCWLTYFFCCSVKHTNSKVSVHKLYSPQSLLTRMTAEPHFLIQPYVLTLTRNLGLISTLLGYE